MSGYVDSQDSARGGKSRYVSREGILRWLICVLAAAAAAGGTANGATYYLDAVAGNDGGAGTSLQPWRSLAKAQVAAQPGDTILMRNGSYGPFVADRLAFALYPEAADVPLAADWPWITYQAVPGQDRVDIDYLEFKFGGQPHTVAHAFEGINLTKPKGRCVFVWGVVGLRLENMTLSGTTNVDLLASGTSYYSNVELKGTNNDIAIVGCDIDGGYRGVYADGVNNNVRISSCDVHNTGVDKIMYANGTNITIENCRIYGYPLLPGEHPDCIQFYTAADEYGPTARATNITIRGNMMYDHPSQGLWTDGSYLVNVTFENNLMYKLGNYEWRVYSVHGGLIRNNTIVGSSGRNTGIIIYGDGQNSDITVVNNIFACPYWGTATVMNYHDHNIYVASSASSPGDQETHSYQFPSMDSAIEALFADAVNADYSLADGSKAIDFGDVGSNPGIDLTGRQRDSSPDAGCYEYGSAGTPPADDTKDSVPAPADSDGGDGSVDAVTEKPAIGDAEVAKDNYWFDLIRRAKEERKDQSLSKPDGPAEEPEPPARQDEERFREQRRASQPGQIYRRLRKLRRRHRR